MSQPFSPETRPCPECGGRREAHPHIAPEIIAYSSDAAKTWDAANKVGASTYLLVRCTNCGYLAFFQKETPKHK